MLEGVADRRSTSSEVILVATAFYRTNRLGSDRILPTERPTTKARAVTDFKAPCLRDWMLPVSKVEGLVESGGPPLFPSDASLVEEGDGVLVPNFLRACALCASSRIRCRPRLHTLAWPNS